MALAAAETLSVGAELSADQIIKGMAALVVWEYKGLNENEGTVGQTQVIGHITSEPAEPSTGFFHITPWLPDNRYPGPTSIFSLRPTKAVCMERWAMLQVRVYGVEGVPEHTAPQAVPLKIVR